MPATSKKILTSSLIASCISQIMLNIEKAKKMVANSRMVWRLRY